MLLYLLFSNILIQLSAGCYAKNPSARTALSTESFTFYVGQNVGQDTNVPVDFGRSRVDTLWRVCHEWLAP
jgi:hypothetical protein